MNLFITKKVMDKALSLKEKIIELRKKDKTYFEISTALQCAKSTVAYHCKNANLQISSHVPQKISEFFLQNVQQYYCEHTIKETALHFGFSETTIKRYVNKKTIKLTDEQKRKKNYNRVKTHRQKIKEKGVDYLGGKCQRCGYNKSIWSLHFHHIDAKEKSFSISSYCNLSWNKIKEELDKCELICANCHGEIHHNNYCSINQLD